MLPPLHLIWCDLVERLFAHVEVADFDLNAVPELTNVPRAAIGESGSIRFSCKRYSSAAAFTIAKISPRAPDIDRNADVDDDDSEDDDEDDDDGGNDQSGTTCGAEEEVEEVEEDDDESKLRMAAAKDGTNKQKKRRAAAKSNKFSASKVARESRFVCANRSQSWKRESTLLKHTQEKSCQQKHGGACK